MHFPTSEQAGRLASRLTAATSHAATTATGVYPQQVVNCGVASRHVRVCQSTHARVCQSPKPIKRLATPQAQCAELQPVPQAHGAMRSTIYDGGQSSTADRYARQCFAPRRISNAGRMKGDNSRTIAANIKVSSEKCCPMGVRPNTGHHSVKDLGRPRPTIAMQPAESRGTPA